MPDDGGALIHPEDYGKLVHVLGKEGIPVPFVREILLLESHVVGTGFVKDIVKKTQSIVPGDILPLRREPQNHYDTRAIQVLNGREERIGYVPRVDNTVLSRLMDAGKLLYAKVKSVDGGYNWLRIDIDIYMRDL
ncbi:MAG: HIRAN domain-containing protein [Lentisphaeria bacterium]|nr:HIRAN domain-containing protein [Lentisphaeria bacterium]